MAQLQQKKTKYIQYECNFTKQTTTPPKTKNLNANNKIAAKKTTK